MRLQRTHIIALANQKGGCGKTTAALNIAAACAAEGYRTCLVDIDQQCNATDTFGINQDELAKQGRFTVADAFLAKRPATEIALEFPDRFDGLLSLIPSHRGLSSIPHRLDAELQATVANDSFSEIDSDDLKNEQRKRLRNSLKSLRGRVDFVFIDTPPELGFLMTSGLIASDWYIIPVFPSGYDLKGLEKLTQTVSKIRDRHNPHLQLIGVLLGRMHPRAKLDSDIQYMLGEVFGTDRVFETTIAETVRHREATVYCKTILEHAPGEAAADQFHSVARELFARVRQAERGGETTTDQPKRKVANG